MNKIMKFLEKYLLPMADKLGQNRYLNVLRDAFMLAFPLTIFGSICVVIANLPFLNKFMDEPSLNSFKAALNPTVESSLAIMTVFVVIGIGYYLLTSYEGDGIFGSAIALGAFFILTPFKDGAIPMDRLGAKGMFVGIFTAIVSIEIYKRIIAKGWTIKLPDSVPPAVSKSFSAMIPGSVTLSMFLVIRILFGLTSYGNIHDFVYTVIQTPLVALGGGLPATIVAVLLIQLLWFFGLHGQIIINSVLDPVWNTLSLQNLDALQAGKELANKITKQFIDTYTVGIGGTGMTLAVVAAMLFVMKSKQLREIGKIAAPAGIFNVNEPVIFGLPIVMNPMIFIPWLLAPVVVVIFTYFMMATGIVPLTTGISVPWTMPIFFGGMLATNSIMGGILQIINFFIVFFIWVPFLKIMDIQNLRAEKEVKAEGEYDFSL